MITVVLTLPSAPEEGGLDGSGGDTVEVNPVKIRTTVPYNRIHAPEHAHALLHAVVYTYKLYMRHSRFDLPLAVS